jgi:hypothetical protein
VPAALGSAIAEMRDATSVGTPARFTTACETLVVELMNHSKTWEAGKVDLQQLAGEVNELGHAGLPAMEARDAWKVIDVRLARALEGEKPGPGPRLRLDAPPGVRFAVVEVDNAFHRLELGEACDAVDQAAMRLSQWRWDDPQPQRPKQIEAALDVLDAMPQSCRRDGVEAARHEWNRGIAMLAPGLD